MNPRYEWVWIYAFVNPQMGETYWLLLPTVTIPLFNLALKEFAQAQKVGKDKLIILVIDQAGFHDSKKIIVPEGIRLVFLPPYCPELQPAERLWPLCNEGVANCAFKNIGHLEDVQVKRCQMLLKQQELVSAKTLFHWWPRV